MNNYTDVNMSQKNVLWSSQEEDNYGDVHENDEGMKPIPPSLSQEALSLSTPSNTQESFTGLQVNDFELSDGTLEIMKKTIGDEFDDDFVVPPENCQRKNPEMPENHSSQYYESQNICMSFTQTNALRMITGGEDVKLFQKKIPGRIHSEKNKSFEAANYYESLPSSSTSQQQESQQVSLVLPSGSESCSEVSSSQESNTELPSLITWKGKYNFHVSPAEVCIKRCAYSGSRNKLYCTAHNAIKFHMGVDFNKVNVKSLHVKSRLVFKTSTHTVKPVERCISCRHSEVIANLKAGIDTDENILNHILRCSHTMAKYEQSAGNQRYSVVVPLGKPQPGSDFVAKNYEFKCLSSCKGISRTELCLVFTLLDKRKEVGRHVFDLKICSCPYRDCGKDEGKIFSVPNIRKHKRKSVSASRASSDEIRDGTEFELHRVGRGGTELEMERNARGEAEFEMERVAKQRCLSPQAEQHSQAFQGGFPEERVLHPFQQEDNDESSEMLESCTNSLRIIVDSQKSPDPNKKRLGKLAYRQLKTFLDTWKSELLDGTTEQNLNQELPQELGRNGKNGYLPLAQSPDSGVGVAHTP